NWAALDAAQWDALLARENDPSPFVQQAYLQALSDSHSACTDTGWDLRLLTLWQGECLVAACALYIKSHSYGEYVFDWACQRLCRARPVVLPQSPGGGAVHARARCAAAGRGRRRAGSAGPRVAALVPAGKAVFAAPAVRAAAGPGRVRSR